MEASSAMKFLVDANVFSEATKPQPDEAVLAWLGRHETEPAVNQIILGELEYGILLLPSSKKREQLREWFASGVKHVPVFEPDADTGRVWATLLAELKRKGRAMPITDSLVAASARQHRLTVATRHSGDFVHAGVKVVNPFERSAPGG
jgi:predicted nucleic acid-binding protein